MQGYIIAFLCGALVVTLILSYFYITEPKTEIHANKIKQKGENNDQDITTNLTQEKKKGLFKRIFGKKSSTNNKK